MQYDFLRLSSFFSGNCAIEVRLAMSHMYKAMALHDLSYLVEDVSHPNFLGLPDVIDTHLDLLFELMDLKYTYHPTIINNGLSVILRVFWYYSKSHLILKFDLVYFLEIHTFKFLKFVEKHMTRLSEDGHDVDFEIVDKSLHVLRLIALYSSNMPKGKEGKKLYELKKLLDKMFNCHAMIAKTPGALDLLVTLASQPVMNLSREDIARACTLQDNQQLGSKDLRLKSAVGIAVSICLLFRQFETHDESAEQKDSSLLPRDLTPEQWYFRMCRSLLVREFLCKRSAAAEGDDLKDGDPFYGSFSNLRNFVETFEFKHSRFAFPDPLKM